ncbi:MAG TPA: tRNA lysidine(34) synthetase TilS [Pirellulales bacterium]|jgi:tRNA(Ile)-lysidine synthase|nr:tRNA lysidine(34) synthetase TilS [Pirellulales bacterium]
MPLLQVFEQTLASSWPPERWQEEIVLLAVSGGSDSVALLRAMHALKSPGSGRLAVAHFNHHYRGHEADADERFVSDLCQRLQLGCQIGHGSAALGTGGGDGLEAAARVARYEFLQHSAERLGARYVVTAHTADDQAETVLHHVLRGTGLAGLAGMPRTRTLGPAVTLIRPMLDISRGEVRAYLALVAQDYREDLTNAEVQFTRNRIRHELLPLVKRDYSPGVVDSLLRLANLAADAQRVIDRLVAALFEQSVVVHDAQRVTIDCGALGSEDRHLVRELLLTVWRRQGWPLKSMGFVQWNSLAEMALAPQGGSCKQVFPGEITAERCGEQLQLLASAEHSRSEPRNSSND